MSKKENIDWNLYIFIRFVEQILCVLKEYAERDSHQKSFDVRTEITARILVRESLFIIG